MTTYRPNLTSDERRRSALAQSERNSKTAPGNQSIRLLCCDALNQLYPYVLAARVTLCRLPSRNLRLLIFFGLIVWRPSRTPPSPPSIILDISTFGFPSVSSHPAIPTDMTLEYFLTCLL